MTGRHILNYKLFNSDDFSLYLQVDHRDLLLCVQHQKKLETHFTYLEIKMKVRACRPMFKREEERLSTPSWRISSVCFRVPNTYISHKLHYLPSFIISCTYMISNEKSPSKYIHLSFLKLNLIHKRTLGLGKRFTQG